MNVTELQVIGVILLVAATLFTLWSRLVLGTMWSSAAAVKSDHQLRTDGPYRVTRHPIYTGTLGMLAGTTLVFVGAWPVLLICLVTFLLKISNEEQLMAEQFGEQYAAYKNQVPQLVPGLYLKRKRK
ncbi:MAG: isoprenylcysteine carboxylmethyltransferase family protein [Halobacteriota archaeon]